MKLTRQVITPVENQMLTDGWADGRNEEYDRLSSGV